MKRKIQCVIFSAVLAMVGAARAGEVSEVEPNNPISAPFELNIPGSLTVSAGLGNVFGAAVDDLDFFKFYGQEGDVVDIDIDGAMGGARNFDSVIAVFGTGTGMPMLRLNDDSYPVDTGSTSTLDSRIDKFRLPATGYYIVGVSNYPRFFSNGGSVSYPSNIANGDYKLVISGVTPSVIQINIEIKPGSGELAPINPKAKGVVPVALLSSAEFDAKKVVDTTSLTFGPYGDERSLRSCGSGEDVNGDGSDDLVCHFKNEVAGFAPGDLEGILRGKTLEGRLFEGRGLLKVVPEKRR